MKRATQEDVNKFYENALLNPKIYPYVTLVKYHELPTVKNSDWEALHFVDENHKCYLKITFDRCRDIEFSVCLFSNSSYLAGKCILIVKELINRYKPRAINSMVHSTNIKSLKIHNRVFGKEWGIEEKSAWNMGTGTFDDCHFFRKLL